MFYFFYIFAQTIDCGYSLEPPRRGGSKEYSQSMFLSRNKKNNVYPCKLKFFQHISWLMGSTLYRHVSVMSRNLIRIFTWRILDSQGCKLFLYADNEDCSDCSDAQAALGLRWAHMSEGMFSHHSHARIRIVLCSMVFYE